VSSVDVTDSPAVDPQNRSLGQRPGHSTRRPWDHGIRRFPVVRLGMSARRRRTRIVAWGNAPGISCCRGMHPEGVPHRTRVSRTRYLPGVPSSPKETAVENAAPFVRAGLFQFRSHCASMQDFAPMGEAPLQGAGVLISRSWGVAPGYDEDAPSARRAVPGDVRSSGVGWSPGAQVADRGRGRPFEGACTERSRSGQDKPVGGLESRSCVSRRAAKTARNPNVFHVVSAEMG
jgi:hypothetical protein